MSKAYFPLRPVIPFAMRIAIRRLYAVWLRRRFRNSWPINQATARPLGEWPGWPDNKQFTLVVTHDVEGQKGLERCWKLAELEMQIGLRSSFNFVPEGEYASPPSLRERLVHHGFELGVHGLRHDGRLFSSRRKFIKRARRINHYLSAWKAEGFRSPFMQHELSWLGELNVLYDASTFDTDPFEPQPDGVGTIFPFWVSHGDGRGFVELPYTLPQDSTLFLLLQERTNRIWKRKLDWVASHGGMALVIVHPDYVDFDGKGGQSEYPVALIQDFLEFVVNRYGTNCWFALPRDVARYVRYHQYGIADRNHHLLWGQPLRS